ncbi:TetR/AcrR family transcriptional regulator [Anaerocolumna sp. MB42-C2]|uniref:TetR/AcrR family transcriptional regulator n=1 Tax=Anaerocolumna sp. MB42-C2 TaxID=3070997 RepID=UPI0027DF6EC8|nr:TetR/AcrR family transcriptional regulator [Anaerocolumna sp. MB42-C2]WMJ86554.1 TetR/AcrR family transcriptional regulator [Anaerocolumna sp. MB42-C2]
MDKIKNEGVQKRKKGLETTRQILDAAADLFARNGYDGVSVREIAEKAGIKESSLYNHFKSKSEILETLFNEFIRFVPETRPSDEELDTMLMIMEPEEVFKSILFHVGKSVCGTLSNTAMIIQYEKFRNPRAAEMYYKYVVNEPANYYERLINKMIERKMVKPVDARTIAEQYNYISIVLTKEYIMAQYGLADIHSVVGYMIKTLKFFCGLMKNDIGEHHEKKEEI